MATSARLRSVSAEATIGRPLRKAPPPRVAVNTSAWSGSWTTPATVAPSTCTPIETAKPAWA